MSTQLGELLIAYAVTAGAMLVALLLVRAGARAFWRWPVYSAMAMALGVVLWSMLRKHALPAEWALTRPRMLYFSALALYAVLGSSLGLLLGRLAARRDRPPETR